MIKPANKNPVHTMSKKSLQSLFAQKSWANNELFNALAPVAAEQGAESVHMAIRMLNHIYVVDRIFQAHLLGEPHGYAATNTEATPDLGELQFAVAELDAWFEGYAGNVTAHQLDEPISFQFTDGDAGTPEVLIIHLATGLPARHPLRRISLRRQSTVRPRNGQRVRLVGRLVRRGRWCG